MKSSQGSEPTDMTHRLREVDQHARLLLAQREASRSEPVTEALGVLAPPGLVVAPRRARAFLFHGAGGGHFAEVTLTAPVRSATHD